MPERRILDFQTLDEVLIDVERLMAGHATLGEWTLGQILHHLATAIRVSSRGRSTSETNSVSQAVRHQFFQARRFPEGIEAPHPRLIPPAHADAATQAQALRDAMTRWNAADGPFPPHPRLGTMSKDEWTQFHCIHCAHHLGFAVPL